MKIKLSPYAPINPSETLSLIRRLDVLVINGERYDFGGVAEGATLPASAVKCEALASDVTRVDGQLVLTLMLPCGPDASVSARFPDDIIDPPDGKVSLPI